MYLRGCTNAKLADGEAPALYFVTLNIMRETLAEIGISKSNQEADLRVL